MKTKLIALILLAADILSSQERFDYKVRNYFFAGFFPDFYFHLNLRNPGPVSFITPYEYTRPDEVQAILAGLERHRVKIVLWTPSLDTPENPLGDHLGPLRGYLRSRYHVARDFPEFEVWRRND